MAKDLRTFLRRLEERAPDQLLRVKRPVSVDLELTGVLRKLQSEQRYPAVVFERIQDKKLRVISNLLGNTRLLAEALETTPEELTRTYIEREDARMAVKEVSEAPSQEVVIGGDDVNLHEMPIVVNCGKDQIHSRNRLGMSYEKHTHIGTVHRAAEARGEPVDCAIWVGHHPATLLGCQSKIPYGEDEYEVMGGLLQEPVEVVKARTVDVMVPASAEVVFEGRILPGERLPEGPYGEFTWYYGLERPSPVMEVTAITHRHDAIYHHLFAAHPEHNLTGRLGRESVLYKRVRAAMPGVKDVHMPMSGICRFHAYVQIRKEYDGAGKIAALAALASDPFVKLAVVVDEDVDIHSDAEVLWAIATRTQPDRDTFFVPESATSRLDPASYSIWSRWEKDTMNTKWAIDATKPVEAPFEERADVPREVWESMDLSEYVEGWR